MEYPDPRWSVLAFGGLGLRWIDLARLSRFCRCNLKLSVRWVSRSGVRNCRHRGNRWDGKTEQIKIVIVIPFHGRLFNCAVHPPNLSYRPWMIWLGWAILDPVCSAVDFKQHRPELERGTVARPLTKLDAVVGPDCVDFVRYGLARGFDHSLWKLQGRLAV